MPYCLWQESGDSAWHRGHVAYPSGADPDGSAAPLRILDGNPLTYATWAEKYYGRSLDERAVQDVYALRPLSPTLIQALNEHADTKSALQEALVIGYPTK